MRKRKTNHLFRSLGLLGGWLIAGLALAAPELPVPEAVAPSADTRKSNICFGGLEDGKLIPDDGRVSNQFRQTTELGCTVDGGRPAFMPDLAPLIIGGKLA